MRRALTLLPAIGIASVLLLHCNASPTVPPKPSISRAAYIESANTFTDQYGPSTLPAWQLHATAAGANCDVLVVESEAVLETPFVDALHYGSGTEALHKGGVQTFYRRASFRGVVYKDSTNRSWAFGNVSEDEVQRLQPCRGV